MILGPLGFLQPWVLAGGLGLPVLWVLLRAMPPRPRRQVFPGVALLAGLKDARPRAARIPWWLLLVRMAGLAALILGLAGPVWRPDQTGGPVPQSADAVLVVMDAGWAAAPDWQHRQARAAGVIDSAGNRPVGVLMADGLHAGPVVFSQRDAGLGRIRAAQPVAWPSALPELSDDMLSLVPAGRLATVWLTDGTDHANRADWAATLTDKGPLTVLPPDQPVQILTLNADAALPELQLHQSGRAAAKPAPDILAIGPDLQGVERVLARLAPSDPATAADQSQTVRIDLPSELRNRVSRFVIDGVASAGAVVLADARTRRPKLAVAGGAGEGEGARLLDPGHYLHRAVTPFADLVEAPLAEALQTAPDMIMLIDTVLSPDEAALTRWVEEGGLLIRFAGPRMAASDHLADDPLLPVRLRPGGRETGGALSWGQPRDLAPWPEDSPLAGLQQQPVAVRAQLVAQPGPEVESRTIARLEDATPLITRKQLGAGQVVLFHVAADPSWSDLPLSGLFLHLLQRLGELAQPVTALADAKADAGEGTDAQARWRPQTVLDGWGNPHPAPAISQPVTGGALDAGAAPGLPAGIYEADGRQFALNAGQAGIRPAIWDESVVIKADGTGQKPLGGGLIWLAVLILAGDVLASGLALRRT